MAKEWIFCGRAEPIAQLSKIVESGRWFFCRIEGRRRIGKTSLLGHLARQRGLVAERLIYMQVPDSLHVEPSSREVRAGHPQTTRQR